MGFLDFFLGASGAAQSGSRAALDQRNGFRDLTFGQSLPDSGFREVVVLDDAGNVLYSRPSDSLRIGEADLTSISYNFYRGKLSSVHLAFSDYQEFFRLGEVFLKAYGQPDPFEPGIDRYFWRGEIVTLFLMWRPAEGDGFALMKSLPLERQEALDRDADALKGIEDL